MSEKQRELKLVVAIAVLAVLGVGLDALSDPVEDAPPVATSDPHVERGTFCPPPGGQSEKSQVSVTTVSGAEATIDFQDASVAADIDLPDPKTSQIKPGAFLLHTSDDAALTTIGYGDRPVAGGIQAWSGPVEGAGAALCSARPSDTWYFPAGSSELRFDERLLLYNPYPDEAVARVTFFTPSGLIARTSLNDVAVPSGGWEEIAVNEFVNTQKVLSARVSSVRGRVIAWRALFQRPEGEPRGAGFTLGAPEASDMWFFPHGLLGGGASEKITIINPSDDEANVTIQVFSDKLNFDNPDELNQIRLEPQTSQEISLSSATPIFKGDVDAASLSATVMSNGAVPVVVERTLEIESGPFEGVATEVGATELARRWMLPPAAKTAGEDSLGLFNPGGNSATVDVELYTLEGSETPKTLTGLKVKSRGRLQKSLTEFKDLGPFFAVVESDVPLAAERLVHSSASSDLADVMGHPLGPAEEP